MLDYVNPDCEECNGEGVVTYGNIRSSSDGSALLPCQICFPDGFDYEVEHEDFRNDLD